MDNTKEIREIKKTLINAIINSTYSNDRPANLTIILIIKYIGSTQTILAPTPSSVKFKLLKKYLYPLVSVPESPLKTITIITNKYAIQPNNLCMLDEPPEENLNRRKAATGTKKNLITSIYVTLYYCCCNKLSRALGVDRREKTLKLQKYQ